MKQYDVDLDIAGGNPDWFNMNLSEMVEKSMALGVIPIFQFLDKGSVVNGSVKITKPISVLEATPINILEKEIRFYETLIVKIVNRDGIISTKEETDKALTDLQNSLAVKIKIFQDAISLLNTEQKAQGSDTTESEKIAEAGSQIPENEDYWIQRLKDFFKIHSPKQLLEQLENFQQKQGREG